jgi:hypothetical protein
MRRLIIGFTLLLLVVAILVVLPTVVFGYLWGTEAVIHHWAWVIYLAFLTTLGAILVLTARIQPGQPESVNRGPKRRLRLGFAAFGLVAAILIIAPTAAFGNIFGWDAVLAFWGSVGLLVVMTFTGLVLIFTGKRGARQNS